MNLDVAMHRLAAGQHGVTTRRQLLDLGMSPDQICRRMQAGLLVRRQPSVYTLASVASSFEQRALAACWSAGDKAVVSHRSAAKLWGLRGATSERVEVLVAGTRLPRLISGSAHRTVLLEPIDVRVVRGVPVTRPERTLIDAAAVVHPSVATSMVESAVHLRLATIGGIWAYLSRFGGPGIRGSGVVRQILAERAPADRATESSLEDLAVRVLREHGLPAPVRQHPLATGGESSVRIDLAYPSVGLAIEVDSARWHSDSARYRADRAKWNLLTRLGWAMVILTEFDLRERPAGAAADVSTLLRRLGSSVRVA